MLRAQVLGGALLLGGLMFGVAPAANAAAPSLSAVVPYGANPGTTFPVKFTGKLDGSARRVWCDDPSIVFTLPDPNGNAVVSVAADARPGLHLVRFTNSEGATLPIRFAVGPLPKLDEKEPNDEITAPQPVAKLPLWIQGRLDKAGDVDGYSITLKKGAPLFLKVDAYSLGSPVDMHLHVLDARGVKLATASDGRNLDPELRFIPPEDGVYIVQLAGFAHPPAADVNLAGGAVSYYQLLLTDTEAVTGIFPAALPLTGKLALMLRGQGLKPDGDKADFKAEDAFGSDELGMVFPKGAVFPIDCVRTPFTIQVAPDSSPEQPFVTAPPLTLGGRLPKPGAVAAYKFAMKKGEKLRARFWSRSLGLGVEGDLFVTGPTGTQIAANESPADVFVEPTLVWTAATDGDYTLHVRDLFQRGGGQEHEFVLEVAPPAPEFTVVLLEGKPVHVEPGKSVAIKLKATFSAGYKEPLVVRANGLPEGVYAPEVVVPEKGGEFDLTLHAASNARAATAPSAVSVWTKGAPATYAVAAYPLRGELRRGHSQSDFSRDLWVTVSPAGAAAAATPPKK